MRQRLLLVALAAAFVGALAAFSATNRWHKENLDAAHSLVKQQITAAWLGAEGYAIDRLESVAVKIEGRSLDSFDVRTYALVELLEKFPISGSDDFRVEVIEEVKLESSWANNEILRSQFPLTNSLPSLVGNAPNSTVSGLTQIRRGVFFWVHSRWLQLGGRRSLLTLGVSIDSYLATIEKSLGAPISILNLRGRRIAGAPLPVGINHYEIRKLRNGISYETDGSDGRNWLILGSGLSGLGMADLANLFIAVDVTSYKRSVLPLRITIVVLSLSVATLLCIFVVNQIHVEIVPLRRIGVAIRRLQDGDHSYVADIDDQMRLDEVGDITQGLLKLRSDLLNLESLREERYQMALQQERLISSHLRHLANTLDGDSRIEIMQALDNYGFQERSPRRENQLAKVAAVLNRLSGLISEQHKSLFKLVAELKEALQNQEKLVSLQQELDIARRIQLSILPQMTPLPVEVCVDALMLPAREVGGDFYDYFMLDEDSLAFVVADVSGKGVPAAFFMAISRTLLKSSLQFYHKPSEAITRLNELLCADNTQSMFVTLFLGVLNIKTGSMEYVNAGHDAPLIVHGSGELVQLNSRQNIALAVMSGVKYLGMTAQLQPGDSIFLYTDGVTEAENEYAELFGTQRLFKLLKAEVGAESLSLDRIVYSIQQYEGGRVQTDDITCLHVRFNGIT